MGSISNQYYGSPVEKATDGENLSHDSLPPAPKRYEADGHQSPNPTHGTDVKGCGSKGGFTDCGRSVGQGSESAERGEEKHAATSDECCST